jgi:YesN/AraC family two-component response regulator
MIEKAKNLLLLKDKPVNKTHYNRSFKSLSYLSRNYKKVTGINPTAFKQEYLR